MKCVVIVDDREEYNSHLIGGIRSRLSALTNPVVVEFRRRRLQIGDLVILCGGNAMVVELKTAADLLASIYDGRLFEQARNSLELLSLFDHAIVRRILIVYGNEESAASARTTSSDQILDAAYAALMSITFRWGISIFQVPSRDSLIIFLTRLIVREAKGSHDKGIPQVVSFTKKSVSPSVGVLASLPNIGSKKAEQLLEFYGSPLRVFLDPNLAQSVPGIGSKVVESIQEHVWCSLRPTVLQENPLVIGIFDDAHKTLEERKEAV